MKRYIIHEGETEKCVIDWLKHKGFRLGIPRKHVISTSKKISRALNMINKQSHVIVVIDLDVLDRQPDLVNRLITNLQIIKRKARSLLIITQNRNLEDELKRALNLRSQQRLYEHFDSVSITEYKRKLANMDCRTMDIKCEFLDYDKFWQQCLLSEYTTDEKLIKLNGTLKDIKSF